MAGATTGERPDRGSVHDDVRAITSLLHAYPALIDAGDFAGVAELFRHARLGEGVPDLEQVLRDMVHTYEEGRTSTRHLITNIEVDVAPDRTTATSTSYVTVLQARPDLPLQVIASNTHHDTFAWVDGAWRFSQRTDVPGLLGDLSHHTKLPYGAQQQEQDAT